MDRTGTDAVHLPLAVAVMGAPGVLVAHHTEAMVRTAAIHRAAPLRMAVMARVAATAQVTATGQAM